MSDFINNLRTRAWWKNALSLLFAMLIVLNICLIYSLSAENSIKSSERSEGISSTIAGIVVDGYYEMESTEQQQHVHKINVPLRVFAHFALFALIGLLTTLLIYSLDLQKWYFTFGAPLVFGLLNAIFDEIHQIYSDGRACDISDVMVDFSGVALAVLIINFIMRITLLRSSRKKITVAQ